MLWRFFFIKLQKTKVRPLLLIPYCSNLKKDKRKVIFILRLTPTGYKNNDCYMLTIM